MKPQINVGCGRTPIAGWLNFDNSFTVRLARFPLFLRVLCYLKLASEESLKSAPVIIQQKIAWADATRRLPLADQSVAVVYSSHMLEHLDREGASRFLAEAQRVLVPNGIIRLAVPDLRRRALHYLEHGDADRFMES
jgi:SAM-dependent methyltransferase